MKTLLIAFCALISAQAFAETQLLNRTYKLRVQSGTFACSNPVLPNGHNYPVYTNLTFTLPSFDLWLSNVWTNVSDYSHASDYAPCSDYAKLLRPAPEQDLIATVTQTTTESYHLSGDKKDCMRDTREEAVMVVDGVTLRGSNDFIVGPMDPKLCR
ncbi:MAG: hypothetical protein ACXWR1_15565 [Bdellovibrionota bacterium]